MESDGGKRLKYEGRYGDGDLNQRENRNGGLSKK